MNKTSWGVLTLALTPAFAQTSLNLSQDLVRLGIATSNMIPNQPSLDAGPLFLAGFHYAVTKKIPAVIADKGTYYLLTAASPGAHLPLSAAANMNIDLQGSDLYLTQPTVAGLVVTNSTNLVLENFTIDYQPLPFTQVQILSVDAAKRQFQYSIMPGYRDPSFLNSIFSAGPLQNIINIFRNGHPAPNLFEMVPVFPITSNTITIGPDPTGYATNKVLEQIRPGDIAAIRNFPALAFQVKGCTGCTLRNIQLYAGGWVVAYSPSIIMERVYLIPKPGTDRLTTGSATLFNCPCANGTFRLLRTIRAIDDAFNWYVAAAGVAQSQSGRTVVIQANGGYLGNAPLPNGAPVAFEAPDGTVLGTATIVSQTAVSATKTATFTFDRDLPANVAGAMVYATDANGGGANLLIERNAAEELVVSRGYVISGLQGGTFSGNYVHRTGGSGIDAEHIYSPPQGIEAPDIGVNIKNNVVDTTNLQPQTTDILSTFGGIQVFAGTYGSGPPIVTTSPMQNISITNNFVANPGSSAIWLGNTNIAAIHDNYFLNPNDNPLLDYQYQAFRADFTQPLAIRSSVNVSTSNNIVDAVSGRVWISDTQFNELAAYAPGGAYRLSAYNLGTLANPAITLTDGDGKISAVTIQKTSTHALDVQLPASAGLGGAYFTLNSASGKYFGTLFIDSQDNIPAVNGCTYELSPSATSASATAASLSILVVTQAGCAWKITGPDPFATVNGSLTGTGVATVSLAENTGAARSTTVEIAGWPITLSQAAAGPVVKTFEPWNYTDGIAPGAWVVITAANLGPSPGQIWDLSGVQDLPITLAGVTVSFNGTLAALNYVSPTQINALVPANVAAGPVQVTVQVNGATTQSYTINAASVLPAIYAPAGADGSFYVTAVLPGTATLIGNSAVDSRVSRGAKPGELLDLYMVGLGTTLDPAQFNTSQIFAAAFPVKASVTATLGGQPMNVVFAGLVGPGLYLVRVSIPSNIAAGAQAIKITAGGVQTRSSVFLTIDSLIPALPPVEMLTNGSLESGLDPWQFSVDATQAAGSIERTNSTAADGSYSAHISVTKAGELFASQFYQSGFILQQGVTYTLSFWGKSNPARPFFLIVFDASTFAANGLSTGPQLGTDWKQYSYTFKPLTTSVGRLNFSFGNFVGDIWLDNVSLIGPPLPTSTDPDLMQNGNFESPISVGWHFGVNGTQGAAATLQRTTSTAVDGVYSAQITVATAATNPGNFCAVQFWQAGFPFKQGALYSLQFWAKADSSRVLWMNAVQNGGNFQSYGLSRSVGLRTDWQHFVVTFLSTATDPAARVTFCMGDQAGTVWMDGVTLNGPPREVSAFGPKLIQNGDFEAAFSGTWQTSVDTSTGEEGDNGETVTTVTFDENAGKTLLVVHDLYPSKEALDAAVASGSTGGMTETLDQLDELLVSLGSSSVTK